MPRCRAFRRRVDRHRARLISARPRRWHRPRQSLRLWSPLSGSRERWTMKTLHELPRFKDRWSHLYLERGILDQEATGLVLHSLDTHTPIPLDQVGLLMLGPGISITHAAVRTLADNNCLVAWV